MSTYPLLLVKSQSKEALLAAFSSDDSIKMLDDHKSKREWLKLSWFLGYAVERQAVDLEFPLSVLKDERPDFRLLSDTREIGVELSEIVPQDAKRAEAIWAKEWQGKCGYSPTSFKLGVPPLSPAGIRQRMVLPFEAGLADFTDNDSQTSEFVKQCKAAIDRKVEIVQLQPRASVTDWWLLLTDGVGIPTSELKALLLGMREYLFAHWRQEKHYSRIFIGSQLEGYLCVLSAPGIWFDKGLVTGGRTSGACGTGVEPGIKEVTGPAEGVLP